MPSNTECIPCDITSFTTTIFAPSVLSLRSHDRIRKTNQSGLATSRKGCLANYTNDMYKWACHSHSANHSTTASQYKRQQWAQFVEAKKRIETQNWYFSYLTKGVYSLHKEMTLQNRHTVIALQQVWRGTIVDHYGQTYKWKGLGLPAWLDNCFTNWSKRVLMSAVVHLEQQHSTPNKENTLHTQDKFGQTLWNFAQSLLHSLADYRILQTHN